MTEDDNGETWGNGRPDLWATIAVGFWTGVAVMWWLVGG